MSRNYYKDPVTGKFKKNPQRETANEQMDNTTLLLLILATIIGGLASLIYYSCTPAA